MSHPSSPGQSLFRDRNTAEGHRVESIELFFDLVFVFAVTQLSHALLEDLNVVGALRVALLIFAVWWVWIYTSWVTNWLAPDRIPVRICLFLMMISGLLMAVSIPDAFGRYAMVFAASYAFMQVGRTSFFLWAARDQPAELRRNFRRILVWMCVSSAFWIGGALSPRLQPVIWSVALAVELTGAVALYWVPGLGRSSAASWDISGAHLAERCGLFVIIALGESLLITGTTFAALDWTAQSLAGLASAAVGSILMWWIYFDSGARRAHHRIEASMEPGREGRLSYTYLHVLIVAGIIVSAVADEILLVSSAGEADHHGSSHDWMVIIGGPLLYITGTALFKWSMNERKTPPLSHMIGVSLLLALIWPARAHLVPPLALGMATTAVLLVVATWETLSLRRPAAGAATQADSA